MNVETICQLAGSAMVENSSSEQRLNRIREQGRPLNMWVGREKRGAHP